MDSRRCHQPNFQKIMDRKGKEGARQVCLKKKEGRVQLPTPTFFRAICNKDSLNGERGLGGCRSGTTPPTLLSLRRTYVCMWGTAGRLGLNGRTAGRPGPPSCKIKQDGQQAAPPTQLPKKKERKREGGGPSTKKNGQEGVGIGVGMGAGRAHGRWHGHGQRGK